MGEATRTLIFNTKSRLGLNAGVLISWIVLSLFTLPLVVFLVRRKEMAAAREASENADETGAHYRTKTSIQNDVDVEIAPKAEGG